MTSVWSDDWLHLCSGTNGLRRYKEKDGMDCCLYDFEQVVLGFNWLELIVDHPDSEKVI